MQAGIFLNTFVVCLLLQTLIFEIFAYQIPELTFEKLNDGFRVSIPEDKDVTRVAFNINRNRPFNTFEQGDFSEQIRTPTNGRFVYEVKRQLEDDDKIYAWISVQYKNLIFRKMAEPQVVRLLQSSFNTFTTNPSPTETKQQVDNEPDTTKPNANPTRSCEPTITTATKHNQKYDVKCRGDLIFSDEFNGDILNTDLWSAEVRLTSDLCEDEFVLYNTSNIFYKNGILKLQASVWNDNKHGTEVRVGSLDLGDTCTEQLPALCQREPSGWTVLPPVISGRINTKSTFNFQYGRVVVRAKFPAGDWLYPKPKIISLSEAHPCFHASIAYARGNRHLTNKANTKDIGSQRLSGGLVLTAMSEIHDQFMVNKTSFESFSNDFHIYEMIWNTNHFIFKVDDAEYGRLSANDRNFAGLRASGGLLNSQLALTLGLAAGGHADFPETDYRKPWMNTGPKAALEFWYSRDSWLSSWSDPSLKVDYVHVYAV